jgi:murein DD-endopeptidase MepM/ murein hydrolase activator NlpD
MIRIPRYPIVGASFTVLSATSAFAQTPMPPSTPDVPELVFEAPKTTPAEITPPAPLAIAAPETLPPEVTPPLQVDGAEAFIDRTDYSLGATTPIAATPVTETVADVPSIAPGLTVPPAPEQRPEPIALNSEPIRTPVTVEVGPVHLSTEGIGWQPPEPASPTALPPEPQSVVHPGKPYLPPGIVQLPPASPTAIAFIFPVAIPAPITSIFGWRVHPLSGVHKLHTGTDIGAPMGTPVLAAATGRVMLADQMGGYGLTVALEHHEGMRQTLYGHLSAILVKPGEIVQQGTVIGRVGSTGASTGPHLHFELRELTPNGWVAQDAGQQLQVAMGQLVQALQVTQRQQTKPLPSVSPKSVRLAVIPKFGKK